MNEPAVIREILDNAKTIAVVGLTNKEGRASLFFDPAKVTNEAGAAVGDLAEFAPIATFQGALDALGQTGGKIRSSPLIQDGVAYFASYEGFIYAVDLETHEIKWVTGSAGDTMDSSPAYADGVFFIGSGDLDGGVLQARDAETSDRLWFSRGTATIGVAPTILKGVVYFGNDDGTLTGLDLKTGDRVCRFNSGATIRSWKRPSS